MEAYVQTKSTPTTSEEDQQVTPLMSKTTEYILPDVDPNLSMKKEVEVKVETNQVEQGEGDIPVSGVRRQCFATVSGRNRHIDLYFYKYISGCIVISVFTSKKWVTRG